MSKFKKYIKKYTIGNILVVFIILAFAAGVLYGFHEELKTTIFGSPGQSSSIDIKLIKNLIVWYLSSISILLIVVGYHFKKMKRNHIISLILLITLSSFLYNLVLAALITILGFLDKLEFSINIICPFLLGLFYFYLTVIVLSSRIYDSFKRKKPLRGQKKIIVKDTIELVLQYISPSVFLLIGLFLTGYASSFIPIILLSLAAISIAVFSVVLVIMQCYHFLSGIIEE